MVIPKFHRHLKFFSLFTVIYASNYDNVSRPCSSSAARFQPKTGYQPPRQCGELLIPWRRSPGKVAEQNFLTLLQCIEVTRFRIRF